VSESAARSPIIERLAKHHDRGSFSSGVPELDRYFCEQAGQDDRKRVASPYVLIEPIDGKIAGYYTLSAASLPLSALPPDAARKLPRYEALPATLLGRLAVDSRYQGQGYGEVLLVDALLRSEQQARQIGSFAVLVDAKGDDARTFYERYEFVRLPGQPYRLYCPMKSIQRAFASGRPRGA